MQQSCDDMHVNNEDKLQVSGVLLTGLLTIKL